MFESRWVRQPLAPSWQTRLDNRTIVPKSMRGAVITSLMVLSITLAGCMGKEDAIPKIESTEATDHESKDIENPMQTLQDDCEERAGTWSKADQECYFLEESEEVEDSGPINIPPCSTIASEGLNKTRNPSIWPEIRNGQWASIEGLTNVSYASIEFDNQSDVVVDYRLDWMCGYTYSVKVPGGYNSSNEYPVFLYLHGQLQDSVFFNNMITNNFHIPEDDKYIIVRPSKLEPDWDPKKALDVLEDVKSHLSVDDDRVYLTGLSMGGRGSFIVAAALPDYFAAIMPLSPHHEPYSYLPLAEDVAHLPIWMSHGTSDNTSSFDMAEKMAENLTELGAEIEFHPVVGADHGGWFAIYSDPSAMQWMLSHVRGQ